MRDTSDVHGIFSFNLHAAHILTSYFVCHTMFPIAQIISM